jgi:hypothetical protein
MTIGLVGLLGRAIAELRHSEPGSPWRGVREDVGLMKMGMGPRQAPLWGFFPELAEVIHGRGQYLGRLSEAAFDTPNWPPPFGGAHCSRLVRTKGFLCARPSQTRSGRPAARRPRPELGYRTDIKPLRSAIYRLPSRGGA